MVKEVDSLRLKRRLEIERIIISGLWLILWFILSIHVSSKFIYTWPVFGIAAYFTRKQLFFWQCKDALFLITHESNCWNFGSDIASSLEIYTLSHIRKESSLYDPYFQTWQALFSRSIGHVTSSNYKKSADYLTDDGLQLLRICLFLGEYGVAHSYIPIESWNREVSSLSLSLDTFENARTVLEHFECSNLDRSFFKRSRTVLYADIYPQLIISFHSLESQYPSLVWKDIAAAPYPSFIGCASDIKRDFCACKDLTADKYIIDECCKWCYWHIQNFPSAFSRAEHETLKTYTLKSSCDDIKDVYNFLISLPKLSEK